MGECAYENMIIEISKVINIPVLKDLGPTYTATINKEYVYISS